MPYDLHIVKTKDFIRLDAIGKPDIGRSKQVLAGLAKTCVERGVGCALLDVRDMQSELSLRDLNALAKTFPEMGFQQHHKLAILHRYRAGERAELFAMFASDRGWSVKAFDYYEEAIEWFSTVEPLDQPTESDA